MIGHNQSLENHIGHYKNSIGFQYYRIKFGSCTLTGFVVKQPGDYVLNFVEESRILKNWFHLINICFFIEQEFLDAFFYLSHLPILKRNEQIKLQKKIYQE